MRKLSSNIVRHLSFFFILLLITGGMPLSIFAQTTLPIFEAPETLEEAKQETLDIGGKITKELPGVVKELWNTRVWPVWQDMWQQGRELWETRIMPVLQPVIDNVKKLLGQEVEKRKPILEQELEKEKQEIKEEIQTQTSNATKSIWERFKDLFRKE